MADTAICMIFEGVAGESQIPPRNIPPGPAGGWMDLTSCQFSAAANYGLRGAEHGAKAIDPSVVTVTKQTDASSTGMFRAALLGNGDSRATIVFLRTGFASPQQFVRVDLTGCAIVSFGSVSKGQRPMETFGIRFGRMTITSWAFDQAGQATAQGSTTLENPI